MSSATSAMTSSPDRVVIQPCRTFHPVQELVSQRDDLILAEQSERRILFHFLRYAAGAAAGDAPSFSFAFSSIVLMIDAILPAWPLKMPASFRPGDSAAAMTMPIASSRVGIVLTCFTPFSPT